MVNAVGTSVDGARVLGAVGVIRKWSCGYRISTFRLIQGELARLKRLQAVALIELGRWVYCKTIQGEVKWAIGRIKHPYTRLPQGKVPSFISPHRQYFGWILWFLWILCNLESDEVLFGCLCGLFCEFESPCLSGLRKHFKGRNLTAVFSFFMNQLKVLFYRSLIRKNASARIFLYTIEPKKYLLLDVVCTKIIQEVHNAITSGPRLKWAWK